MRHVVYPATRLDWATVATSMVQPTAKLLVTVGLDGCQESRKGPSVEFPTAGPSYLSLCAVLVLVGEVEGGEEQRSEETGNGCQANQSPTFLIRLGHHRLRQHRHDAATCERLHESDPCF